MQAWDSQGLRIEVVQLTLDDPGEGKATPAGAKNWRDEWGLHSVYVGADPDYTMVPGSEVGTPQLSIIDPRTMKVTLIEEGFGGSYPPQLTSLAQSNKP